MNDDTVMGRPKVSFGIIVLNGEPFTRYCLRSLYPFAHEIIVVEGGHEDTGAVATPDGHSTDGTVEALLRFKEEEDPLDKVQIVMRDGFWPKEDELGRHRTPQSRAYAERATGHYLWQVDIDEFYRPGDMQSVLDMLLRNPSVTAVTFTPLHFWGGLDYQVDSWNQRRNPGFHRLFKWGPGYSYVTHEPPTIHDDRGRDLRDLRWVGAESTARQGIFLYHYSHLLPRQVMEKAMIYRDEKPADYSGADTWAETNYLRLGHPYRVERYYFLPSWLTRFDGDHPPEVVKMMADIREGRVQEALRQTDDIEQLVNSRRYQLGCRLLEVVDPFERLWRWISLQAVRASHIPRKLAQLRARTRGA